LGPELRVTWTLPRHFYFLQAIQIIRDTFWLIIDPLPPPPSCVIWWHTVKLELTTTFLHKQPSFWAFKAYTTPDFQTLWYCTLCTRKKEKVFKENYIPYLQQLQPFWSIKWCPFLFRFATRKVTLLHIFLLLQNGL
jgi:hypothetical protein